MDWIAAWKAFVAWFPDVYKAMFAFAVISGCLLFFPWSWLTAMHLEAFAASYRPAEWLIFGGCLILLLLVSGDKIWSGFREHREMDARLNQLSGFELRTVQTILKGLSVIQFPHDEPVVHLYADGILWRERTIDGGGRCSFGLKPQARKRAIALGIGSKKMNQ